MMTRKRRRVDVKQPAAAAQKPPAKTKKTAAHGMNNTAKESRPPTAAAAAAVPARAARVSTETPKPPEQEGKMTEPDVEREPEHNYSKDPIDELMKMNLPVYACSLCKRYTFDPQQSALHSRKIHNGRVGIMLMVPLEHIELPSPATSSKPPAESAAKIIGTPAVSSAAKQKVATPKGQQVQEGKQENLEPKPKQQKMQHQPPLQLSRLASSEERGQKKIMYECGKCGRQFDRERQMNMHKCLDLTGRKSPRRGEEGKSPRRGDSGKKKLVAFQALDKRATLDLEEMASGQLKEDDVVEEKKQAGDDQENVKSSDDETGKGTQEKSESLKMDVWKVTDPPPARSSWDKIITKPTSDKRGVWKLCKTRDASGVKWEAQKVSNAEVVALREKNKETPKCVKKERPIAVEKEAERSVMDDEDDDFDEDEFFADNAEEDLMNATGSNESEADKSAVAIGTGSASQDCDKLTEAQFTGEDEMVKQWETMSPPTNHEINQYIKIVIGGLQSGDGQPLEFYMCLICRKVFKTKAVIRPHIFAHLGYRPHACDKCEFRATHTHALTAHMRKHIGEEFSCVYSSCGFVGKDKADIAQHRKSHIVGLRCALCNLVFDSQNTTLGHLFIKHSEEIKSGEGKEVYTKMAASGRTRSQIVLFECDICGQKHKTKKAYYSHIKIHRDGNGPSDASPNVPTQNLVRMNTRRRRVRREKAANESFHNVLHCPLCPSKCRGEANLKTHMMIHPFVYRCCMCEEKFLTYGALNEHVGSHRDQVEDFNAQERINESLRRSMYIDGQMDKSLEADKVQWAQRRTGALAPKSAMTGTVFDELMSKISIPSESVGAEELKELGGVFEQISYKKLTPSILRYIHLRFGNVECGVCGKLFPKVGLCKDHTKRHTKVKEYKCSKCSFQGGSRLALVKHLARVHKEGETYHCDICNFDITGRDLYKHHMRRHIKENDGPFTCSWCNTVEQHYEAMKNHITNTHPMMPLSESTKIMGKGVVVHREKGAPFLVCEVCNETFRRICDLRRHMWKHSSVKRFTCDICDYGSDKRGNIISHMRKHTKDKNYVCSVCGKLYKTEQSLKLHVRTAHLKLRPFKCDVCDYSASQPVHLRRHQVLHHGAGERRRYRCAFCPDYKATDLQVVKRHYKKKHPKEQINLSKCCPTEGHNPSQVKKDKHQVIQVVPSLPAAVLPEGTTAPEVAAEEVANATEEAEQTHQLQPGVNDEVVEVRSEENPQISQDMTVEVILQEEHAQLIDINSSLPDVINALAALQESDLNSQ